VKRRRNDMKKEDTARKTAKCGAEGGIGNVRTTT